jgi:hypothetical protein
MSDTEFMITVCNIRDLRDSQGFINYLKFQEDILNLS